MLLSYSFVPYKRNDVIPSPPIMLHGTSQFFLIMQTAHARRGPAEDLQAIARTTHLCRLKQPSNWNNDVLRAPIKDDTSIECCS
jgi:hypothetical protein